MLWLEQIYHEAKTPQGAAITYRLHNLSGQDFQSPVFNATSQIFINQTTKITGANLQKINGTAFWLSAPTDFTWFSGEIWSIKVEGLSHLPQTASDGAFEAVIWDSQTAYPMGIGALKNERANRKERAPIPTQERPDYSIIPWPNHIKLSGDIDVQGITYLGESSKTRIVNVAQLYARLFPTNAQIFSFESGSQFLDLCIENKPELASSAYILEFNGQHVKLCASNSAGEHYGLITLAQLIHAKLNYNFSWPESGHIYDAPKFAWRGLHLDVSRHFFSSDQVENILDLAAWFKYNRFHWHLTDDEGWRLPSKKYPELNSVASWRGPQELLGPQYSNLTKKYGGFYSAGDIEEVVGFAKQLHIEIMPEIDLPGHSLALLGAKPELLDFTERTGESLSVQGYANNVLNPANEDIYPFLESAIEEILPLFPFEYFHIGGDEVAENSWLNSSSAKAFMQSNNLNTTGELQNYFTARLHAIIRKLGKKTAAWDECGEGNALEGSSSLLFAWRSKEKVEALLRKGFQVVVTPGQAYYLDMYQNGDWNDFGASWAGISSPQDCYIYRPPHSENVLGVQAGIWTEKIRDLDRANAIAFPRLYAIAESGWTEITNKSWSRFSALSSHQPKFRA